MKLKLNHVTCQLTCPRSFSKEMPSSVRRFMAVSAITRAFPECMGTNPRKVSCISASHPAYDTHFKTMQSWKLEFTVKSRNCLTYPIIPNTHGESYPLVNCLGKNSDFVSHVRNDRPMN